MKSLRFEMKMSECQKRALRELAWRDRVSMGEYVRRLISEQAEKAGLERVDDDRQPDN